MISKAEFDSLVDARWIADHLNDPGLRVVEVDVSPATYKAAHIPGAVFWNAYADLRDSEYRAVPASTFAKVLERSGISPGTTVVFYGYGALLGFWLMKAYGHSDVRMLNGARDEWEAGGGNWSDELPAPPPAAYPVPAEDPGLLASQADIEAATSDGGCLILDVRAPSEFNGERFWPSGATEGAGRAGHIPGAINVPIDLVRDESGAVRDADELRELYLRAGITPDQKVITYCTIGNRASLAWYILKYILGYPDVSVYHGSYVEWGKLPDSRVEAG